MPTKSFTFDINSTLLFDKMSMRPNFKWPAATSVAIQFCLNLTKGRQVRKVCLKVELV